jgi:hypothetical protein
LDILHFHLKGRRWDRLKDKQRREDIVVEIGGKDKGMKFAMKGVRERIDLSAPLGSLGGGAQYQGKWWPNVNPQSTGGKRHTE